MADDVQFTVAANATPPGGTFAATDETASGPHSVGSHMGVAKLAVSADGDSTHVPATVADGLLVEVSNPTAGGGLTDVELRATPVVVSGTVLKDLGGTATRTAVADNAADTLILAANAGRFSFSVTNDSSATLYLALGAVAASLTSYTAQVPPNSFFSDDTYAGEVRGIWASDPGDGAARVTEVT